MTTAGDDVATQVLGPALAGRACGECAVCCNLLTIHEPSIAKPAGQWCKHCTGSGCGIYETRPQICRDWFCAWRRIGQLPEGARPDVIGVMFELVRPETPRNLLTRVYLRGLATRPDVDFSHPLLSETIQVFRRGMIPVWLAHGDQMSLVHPVGELATALLNNTPASTFAVEQEARKWRRHYEGDW